MWSDANKLIDWLIHIDSVNMWQTKSPMILVSVGFSVPAIHSVNAVRHVLSWDDIIQGAMMIKKICCTVLHMFQY